LTQTHSPFSAPKIPLDDRQVEHADNEKAQADNDIYIEKRLIYP
jgi:hypothetical protein